MDAVIISLRLVPGSPVLATDTGRATLFGVWLRERVIAAAAQSPAIRCHVIALEGRAMSVVLVPAVPLRTRSAIRGCADRIRRRTELAALAMCGLSEGNPLWLPDYDFTLARSTTAMRRKTTFIDHAAT
ncbi:MAG TPA: hypothetical protein VGM20_15100 [Gemmatimonadales bacterium]|jgi:hypothetical protein